MHSQWHAYLSKTIRTEPHTENDARSASFVRFHSFNFTMPITEYVGTIKDLVLIWIIHRIHFLPQTEQSPFQLQRTIGLHSLEK